MFHVTGKESNVGVRRKIQLVERLIQDLLAKAKAAGKYKGRKSTARTPGNYITVADRLGAGDSSTKIAANLGMRSSVYRINEELKDAKTRTAA